MIIQIIFYFFLIFGIVQFGVFIWELLIHPSAHNAVILYPVGKEKKDPQASLYYLSKLSFPIYAVSAGDERDKIVEKMAQNITELELVDQSELIDKINTIIK